MVLHTFWVPFHARRMYLAFRSYKLRIQFFKSVKKYLIKNFAFPSAKISVEVDPYNVANVPIVKELVN